MIILFIIILIWIYINIRMEKVSNFRLNMMDEDYESYLKLPKYEIMIFSFKRLKKEYWINK